MEDLNIFGNDFLSNGEFHQLYTMFDHPHDILLWDNRDLDVQPKWNYIGDLSFIENGNEFDYNNSGACQVDFTNYADSSYNHFESMPTCSTTNSAPNSINNYNFGESIGNYSEPITQPYITDMDEWKQNHLHDLPYHPTCSNEWDLSLENLLVENPYDAPAFNVCDLPERTFYCNDSCTNFLKETSENLDTSLKTFQPKLVHELQEAATNPVHLPSNGNTIDFKKYSSTNSEEKEFMCTFGDCRKVYAKAGHLKAHIRRHIGDKPYVCNWPNCTWKFSRSDELSRHRRSHSGIKPYPCDLCPKCFSRSDHLTKHRKVHERKMAAMKVKTIWTKLPPRKPGRKPKSQTANQ